MTHHNRMRMLPILHSNFDFFGKNSQEQYAASLRLASINRSYFFHITAQHFHFWHDDVNLSVKDNGKCKKVQSVQKFEKKIRPKFQPHGHST